MTENSNSPSSQHRAETDPEARQERELLEQVLTRLQIQSWDVLLVGDGSGSGWNNACGWAAALVDRATRGRRLFYGAMNLGSVNLAESLPYLQAIQWYDVTQGRAAMRQRGILEVHLLTDSQVIAQWCQAAMDPEGQLPRKGLAIWAALREYRRAGYQLRAHWGRRMTTELNWTADLIAGLCRRQLQESQRRPLDASAATRAAHALDDVQFLDPQTGQPLSIYHVNPD